LTPSAGPRTVANVRADPARAWSRLAGRTDVAFAAACAHPADRVRAVGGAVRDAFLGRRGGDLDLVVAPGKAAGFAERLASRAGTRVIPIGAAPKRILKIPFHGREIDIWEEEGGTDEDLLRRDITINALSFTLPDGRFAGAPGALADLASRRLAPPRPGVFMEDPLRVLRAGRFLAQFPGFHVSRAALPEMKRAGRRLRTVAAERRLVELDKLLGAPSAGRTKGLRLLARLGALQSLLRSSAPRMRRGISLVRRLESSDPRVARALLLLPQGSKRAKEFLRQWNSSRKEQRLANRLLCLPLRRKGRGAPTRREVAELLRRSSPFEEEATAFLRAAGDSRTRALADAAEKTRRRPATLRRILKPRRPLPLEEIRTTLSLLEGPRLGAALDAFDLALAAGEIRGPEDARGWLRAHRRVWKHAARLLI
jgi:tRNA nucleotidyltransferase/poly(A) polymerase